MTKEELIAVLQEIKASDSVYYGHEAADDALIEYISDREIALAYMAVPKWFG